MIASYILLGLVIAIGLVMLALMRQGMREVARKRGIPRRMLWATSYPSAALLGLLLMLVGGVSALRVVGMVLVILAVPMLIGRLALLWGDFGSSERSEPA